MRCKVCKSEFRKYYEELRSKGMSIPRIFDEARKIGETFSTQSLYRHFQNHYNSEGIRIIPDSMTDSVVIVLFKDYIDEKGLNPVSQLNRLRSLFSKYLDRPYWESKNQLYKALKSVIEELDDFDTDTFNELWNQAISQPIYTRPFNGLSFNEYFEKQTVVPNR